MSTALDSIFSTTPLCFDLVCLYIACRYEDVPNEDDADRCSDAIGVVLFCRRNAIERDV